MMVKWQWTVQLTPASHDTCSPVLLDAAICTPDYAYVPALDLEVVYALRDLLPGEEKAATVDRMVNL